MSGKINDNIEFITEMMIYVTMVVILLLQM